MSPDDIARRLASKRFNERVKLGATFLNNCAVATLVGAVVIPVTQDVSKLGLVR